MSAQTVKTGKLTGTVTSWAAGKGFGFLRGEDGLDYFAHRSALPGGVVALDPGAFVEFEPTASPKGNKALEVRVLGDSIDRYEVPSEPVVLSRTNTVGRWQVLEASSWSVSGSGRQSLDQARLDLMTNARRVKANAVINTRHHTSVGFEPGFGKGIHLFTIHHITGQAAVVGLPSLRGKRSKKDLVGIDERAPHLKQSLRKDTLASALFALAIWVACPVLLFLAAPTPARFPILPFALAVGGVGIGFWLAKFAYTNHDAWLSRMR